MPGDSSCDASSNVCDVSVRALLCAVGPNIEEECCRAMRAITRMTKHRFRTVYLHIRVSLSWSLESYSLGPIIVVLVILILPKIAALVNDPAGIKIDRPATPS